MNTVAIGGSDAARKSGIAAAPSHHQSGERPGMTSGCQRADMLRLFADSEYPLAAAKHQASSPAASAPTMKLVNDPLLVATMKPQASSGNSETSTYRPYIR